MGQRGCQSSVGAAAVRSGALNCCQVSCLTFLRSVGVWGRSVVRDSAGRRALAHVRPVLSGRAVGPRIRKREGQVRPAQSGSRGTGIRTKASLVKVGTSKKRGFLSAPSTPLFSARALSGRGSPNAGLPISVCPFAGCVVAAMTWKCGRYLCH